MIDKEGLKMIYMNRDTFELFSYNTAQFYADEEFNYTIPTEDAIYQIFIELDDLIAPIVSLLNKKGYKTYNSCSGHPFSLYSLYIMLDGNQTKIFHDALLQYDKKHHFTTEYVFNPYGNNSCNGATETTTIRISFNVSNNHKNDYNKNYYKAVTTNVRICEELYNIVSRLPDNK